MPWWSWIQLILTVFLAVLLITPAPVRAERNDSLDGLTESQRAKLLLDAATLKEQNARNAAAARAAANKAAAPAAAIEVLNKLPDAPKVEKLSQWAQVGVDLGKGMVAVAKELGIAVNDFAKTPVGILTAAVIIYKLMGRDIIHYSVGFTFIVVFGTTWLYIFRRVCLMDRIEYTERLEEKAPNKKVKLKNKTTIYGTKWKDTDGFTVIIFLASAIAIPAVGLQIMFT